ncbi:hypothetical protein SAMN06265220_10936 [Flavobacterium nitrogenifigens]|uniref:Uncharacterized protein n=1 Tax=Flavobacterium nitrogenifigens TaxID=1617283 RepID=A0A521FCP9_9FLAO|nr:hypothetical protein SAMN06265220_10936 [Flavobacterium nitrogenifigens]
MFLCVKIKFGAIAPNGQEPIFNFSATIYLFAEADLFGKPIDSSLYGLKY